MRTKSFTALALILSLGVSACSGDQITTLLAAAVDAAITADGIARPQDAPYLTEATACMDVATVELATADSPALKAARIAIGCEAAADAGAGAPVGVQAVVAALADFLRIVNQAAANQAPPKGLAFTDAQVKKATKVDKKHLKEIRVKVEKLKAKYPKKPKKN